MQLKKSMKLLHEKSHIYKSERLTELPKNFLKLVKEIQSLKLFFLEKTENEKNGLCRRMVVGSAHHRELKSRFYNADCGQWMNQWTLQKTKEVISPKHKRKE